MRLHALQTAVLFCASGAAAAAPSFSCDKASQPVEHMICADTQLAELDQQLADTYAALQAQPSTDAKRLRKEEDSWLSSVRNRCADRACVDAAYRQRIASLRQQSQQQASPAAYAETRPFPISEASWSAISATIGKACQFRMDLQEPRLPSFELDPAMRLPVMMKDSAVVVRRHGKERVAVLLKLGQETRCTVADAVALPSTDQAATLLSCGIFDLQSYGVGIRIRQQPGKTYYWEVTSDFHLVRQPLETLGATRSIRCSEPEFGE